MSYDRLEELLRDWEKACLDISVGGLGAGRQRYMSIAG
jgi:hypothetical protein